MKTQREEELEALLERRRAEEAAGLRRPHRRIADVLRPAALIVYYAMVAVVALVILGAGYSLIWAFG